ncbi:MAG: amino acid ABC transporter permease, partial [Atopobiaceae bacterium]|nr:amino acid ABC transporter permease [Atopobiaceae bacterium]
MRGRFAQMWRALLVAFVIVFAGGMLAVSPALALTTEKATARPNEDGGKGVIGGLETRLTWEGMVEEGEEVKEVYLGLPETGTFEGSTTKVTVLDGLDRMPIEGEVKVDKNTFQVTLSEPAKAGYKLRLEIEGMTFPPEGGDISI